MTSCELKIEYLGGVPHPVTSYRGGVEVKGTAPGAVSATPPTQQQEKPEGRRAWKNWCFTRFTTRETLAIDKPTWNAEHMKWLNFQVEECPETKRWHYQGYFELWKQTTAKKAASFVSMPWGEGGHHIEARNGTAEQARNYCMKPESAIPNTQESFGTWGNTPGKRTDLDEAVKCQSITELAENHPKLLVKYSKGFERLFATRQKKRQEMPRVVIYWGPAGTGKSWAAVHSSNDVFMAKGDLQWWDRYEQNHTVIIDEFEPEKVRIDFLLKLLDRYPLSLPTKGGFIEFNSPVIIITSHHNPEHWYPADRKPELWRRIAEIVEFEKAPEAEPKGPIMSKRRGFV